MDQDLFVSNSYYISKEAEGLYLYDIDSDRAASLKEHLSGFKDNVFLIEGGQLKDVDFFSGIQVIINATPLGLKAGDPLPLDISMINRGHAVCDLIYKETPLLSAAAKLGCKTMNGHGMLLWQGVYAFEIWTGQMPPVQAMRQALIKG
ncbi:MAG: hypothetical protein L0Y62_00905, partial [Nitrospirae bacterium]|nr:hypothetical protein [Nitrospirota bacterium]